jgi:hypothetical protein
MSKENDFTPSGVKLEGQFENDRNADSAELFKAILREAFGEEGKEFDTIIGHHLIYVKSDKREDGFTYTIVEEIPSADALIFDHDVARVIWPNTWRHVLTMLALEPVETRDAKLARYFRDREAMDGGVVRDHHKAKVLARGRVSREVTK